MTKKWFYSLLVGLGLPTALHAQHVDDDLYYIPSKQDKQEAVKPTAERRTETDGTTRVVVVNRNRKRNIDEYNRRGSDNVHTRQAGNDTLYIVEQDELEREGRWVSGEFQGSDEDYEYAERIIRFRHPRFAVSIASPLYWDMVYGVHSWDWNVYTDGLYAYAFPTFSNPLWWDWRYRSYGWGGWYGHPYYSSWHYRPGYWGGYYGGYYGGLYGHGLWGYHYGPHYGGSYGWYSGYRYSPTTYTSRSSVRGESYGTSTGSVRRWGDSSRASYDRSSSAYGDGSRTTGATRRVIGTSTYSRPSSTRSYGSSEGMNSGSRTSTYSRGSSTTARTYTPDHGVRSSSYGTGSTRSSSSYGTGSTRSSSSYGTGSTRTYSGESSRVSSGRSSRR